MSGICITNCQWSRLERLVRLHMSRRRRLAMRMRLGPCNRGCAITRRDELDQVIGELIGGWGTETSRSIPARSGIETHHCHGNPIGCRAIADPEGGGRWHTSFGLLGRESDQLLDYLCCKFFMYQETSGVPQPVVRSYPGLALNPPSPNAPSAKRLSPTVMSWNVCLSRPWFRS
jgi:hypothetical protein